MSTLQVTALKSHSSGAPTFHNSSGTEKGQLCKAWIKTEGASATILDSFGFSSMTDHRTGQMTFTFSNAMSSVNYCVVGAHAQGSRTNPNKFWWVKEADIATGSFRTEVNTGTGGLADLGKYNCAVFDS